MRIPLTKKVEGFTVEEKSVSQLVSEMGKTGYQGRKLAEAVDLWEKMVKEDDLVIVLGLAGSMSTAGQWTLVNWLIKNRFVDVIVSTGANVSEDIVDAMGLGYWQATQTVNDEELLEADINRYYDVYGIETDYRKMERTPNRIPVNPENRHSVLFHGNSSPARQMVKQKEDTKHNRNRSRERRPHLQPRITGQRIRRSNTDGKE